jgi:DNA-binding NarL/FixJ family response regulator
LQAENTIFATTDKAFYMSRIKLFLVDDHQLLTDTLTLMLNQDDRFEVIGSTQHVEEVIPFIKTARPDIILLDIALGETNGFDLTCEIMRLNPHPQVIAVSLYSMPAYVKKMMSAGASGYVNKNSSKEELILAILEVYAGNKYICQEIKDKIVKNQLEEDDQSAALNSLTRQELDIIGYIKLGLSSREIADKKGITLKTVEVHRYNILKKLGLNNAAALVNLVNLRGL